MNYRTGAAELKLHYTALQVNFEKEPRERYIQLLGYDKTELAEKVSDNKKFSRLTCSYVKPQ